MQLLLTWPGAFKHRATVSFHAPHNKAHTVTITLPTGESASAGFRSAVEMLRRATWTPTR